MNRGDRARPRHLVAAGGIGAVAAVLGAGVWLGRQWVLHDVVVPLVARHLTGDGQVDPDGVEQLAGVVSLLGLAGLGAGLALLAWSVLAIRGPAGLSATAPATAPAPARPPPPPRPLEAVVVAVAVSVYALLGSALMPRGLAYDEIFTTQNFVDTPSVWDTVSKAIVFNNHVAYSLAARASRGLFGDAEWALRLPAFLMALGALVALWRVGRRLVGPGVTMLAVMALAVSPSLLEWGTSARGYTGLMLCSLLSGHLYLQLLQRPCPREAAAFVALSALGCWFHLYGVWITATQALHLLIVTHRARRGRGELDPAAFAQLWNALLGVAVLTTLLHAPLLPRLVLALVTRPPGTFQLDMPVRVFADLSGRSLHMATVSMLFFALVFVAGAAHLIKTRRRCGLYVALLFVVPLTAMWVLAPYDLYPRFFLFLLPWHVLLLAQGVAIMWAAAPIAATPWRRRLVRGLWCLVLAVWAVGWGLTGWATTLSEGYREAADAMALDADDDVLMAAIGGGGELVQYYLDRPVYVPETLEDFRRRLAESPEVRLLHRKRPWEPAEHTAIAEALLQRAPGRGFGNRPGMRVYRLQP